MYKKLLTAAFFVLLSLNLASLPAISEIAAEAGTLSTDTVSNTGTEFTSETGIRPTSAQEEFSKETKTPKIEDIKVMTPNANTAVKNEVLRDTNQNIQYTIKKFLYTMAAVAISSVLIFLILVLLNKLNIIQTANVQKKSENRFCLNKDDINAPTGENDALRVFFDKTR